MVLYFVLGNVFFLQPQFADPFFKSCKSINVLCLKRNTLLKLCYKCQLLLKIYLCLFYCIACINIIN